ncbi:Panacea domain-containing protein [Aeromonas sobria]|uniref:Panacea domain-containing protein n=1 Tax=Aeromonas sobria TaxID=646 RepID=UPI0011DF31C7|nr:Panacea domain-containing protein [Aeromonas sobria]
METIVKQVLKYILLSYPYKDDLSASRLTKMIYLTDWKCALEYEKQFTNKVWHFNHYGPYIDDFVNLAKNDNDIKIINTHNIYGGHKQLFELKMEFNETIVLPPPLKNIVDFVISATKDKNYEEFIKLVYSTYPVISSSQYTNLDLVSKAREYKAHLANS